MYFDVPGYDPSSLHTSLMEQGASLAREAADQMKARGVDRRSRDGRGDRERRRRDARRSRPRTPSTPICSIMGTHGRKGFQRLILGSVAERCLRQATLARVADSVGGGERRKKQPHKVKKFERCPAASIFHAAGRGGLWDNRFVIHQQNEAAMTAMSDASRARRNVGALLDLRDAASLHARRPVRRRHRQAGEHHLRDAQGQARRSAVSRRRPLRRCSPCAPARSRRSSSHDGGREQVRACCSPAKRSASTASSEGEHTCTAIALEDSSVCIVPYARFERMCRETGAMQERLHQLMSRADRPRGEADDDARLAARGRARRAFLLDVSRATRSAAMRRRNSICA